MEGYIYKQRENCRLCDGKNLILVLPIKPSPIADNFVSFQDTSKEQPIIPLDLYQCRECGHAQNLDIVNPDLLFRDYLFTTGSSAGLVEHFKMYAAYVVDRFSLQKNNFVVEIGSNDGTLLKYFVQHGLKVLGVDPANDIAKTACSEGIETLQDYFILENAIQIRSNFGLAKLIVANNVFAHSDDLSGIVKGIELLLDDEGIFVFEVSYLLDIIDKFIFDTIYHEHLSYHSIKPLDEFFKRHGLKLFDIQSIPTKGGSIRCFVQKQYGPHVTEKIIEEMIRTENERGLHSPKIFNDYEKKIQERKLELLDFLKVWKDLGLRVVGYGASTTVTTLLYHFDLTDKLEYLVDDNVKKQGLYSPGCHLKVMPPEYLYSDRPDIVIILAWQYADQIVARHKVYLDAIGKFIIPLPKLKIYIKN